MKNDKKEPFLDRVLLHSKNADERLFDMVLRFITFVILIIIVWLYADLVHVKADDSQYIIDTFLGDNTYDLKPYFNDTDYLAMHTEFPDIPYNSVFSFGNVNVRGKIVVTDQMDIYNKDVLMLTALGTEEINIWLFDHDEAVNNHLCITNSGYLYSDAAINFTYIIAPMRDSLNTARYGYYEYTIPAGYNSMDFFTHQSYELNFTSIPLIVGTQVNQNNILDYYENGNNVPYCYNANYFTYDDLLSIPQAPVESDENHLYLKNYNIGLTSANSIIDSNLVCNMEWDNWVNDHISDYYVTMQYVIDYVGEPWATAEGIGTGLHFIGVEDVPLAQFKTYYSKEFRSILSLCQVNNEVALEMFEALDSAGAYIYTPNGTTTLQDVLNGSTANYSVNTGSGGSINIGVLYNYLHEHLEPAHAGESTVYISHFVFTCNFYIHSKNTEMSSGKGGKSWDFLNGNSDNFYDVYNNYNPFEGSTSEGRAEINNNGGINNSNVAYGGNANANASGGNVGNITITTGNGYKDTELHQLTNQDIVQNHQKIITVIEDLKYCFHQFAQENNHNSFIQMIYDDYNYIPGIEYITSSIIIICGVCILIFIIKIAF